MWPLGHAEPLKGSFRDRHRGYVRPNICDFFFLLWNLNFVSLGKNSIYLHKRFALGLRNHHIDVNSSEEADSSKDDETVGPNGLLDGREHEAHDEVGEPVYCPVHHEGGRPGGLQEDLSPHHGGDGTGPDGMSRDVGEDADDTKIRQLRDRALLTCRWISR